MATRNVVSLSRLSRAFALTAVAALVAAGTVLAGSLADGPEAEASPRSAKPVLPDPAGFAVRVVRLVGANRYREVWADLHPRHRAAAGLKEYVECESLTPIPGAVRQVEVLGVFDDAVRVAGLSQAAAGKAVAVRITIAGGLPDQRVVVKDTVHLVPVGARWAWILPPQRFDDYLADRCPAAAAGPNIPR